LLALLGVLRVNAQDAPAPQLTSRAEDESNHRMGRISLVQRDVSTLRADSKDWVAATANAAVQHGDCIATGPGSRTELQLDYANILRLDQSTEIRVAELVGTRIQIQVASGLVDFAVFKGTEADVEIDTPNIAIHPLGEGIYRVQVISPEDTELTVRRGHAEVTTPHGGTDIGKGQFIHVKGRENSEYQTAPANDPGEWDRWNDDRDHTIATAQSWQYTNIYYTGSEDLDRYGDWVQVPGYDWCWAPYVDAGWVPYRDGRWVSDPYYGWSWVGYEPWGWTPYHYGRWFFYGGQWCWWPGVGLNGPRPIWGPAFVAFLGFGAGAGGPESGAGFDSIGWCPMGPRDPYNPWWGRGLGFNTTEISNLNAVAATKSNDPGGQTYGSNLQGIMTNGRLRAVISAVSAQNFSSGRIAHNLQLVDENMLQQASLIQGTLPVTPTQASLQPVNRPVNPAALPAAEAINQHFVTRSAGPASHASLPAGQTIPMVNDQGAGANVPARAGLTGPATPSGTISARPDTAIAAQTAQPLAGPPGTQDGWRKFTRNDQTTPSLESMNKPGAGDPQKAVPAPKNAPSLQSGPAPQSNATGWRRFSGPPAQAHPGAENGGAQGEGGWNHFKPPPNPGATSPAPREEGFDL